jgi:TRAP-type C4-dicarboxylate transport system permease small subunit
MKKSKVLKCIDTICIIMLIILVLLGLAQILFRYVLQISVPWTEEVARMVYSFMIFTGVILVESENGHMKTTFLINKLPIRGRVIFQSVINLMCIIFCGGLSYGAIKMLRSSWTYKMGSLPMIPTAIVYIPIIIGMPLVIYFLVIQILQYKKYFPDTEN